jgi:type II secretory pathway pseudopilin PulG
MLVAAMGAMLSVAAEVWQTAQKRDKEAELLFIGDQFRRAISMHLAAGAGYPVSLEDLVRDSRFPGIRRHLRKIYRDPFTGQSQWGLVRHDGKVITGVFSLAEGEPLKQTGFRLADQAFEGRKKYSEWVFSPGSMAPASTKSTPAETGAARQDATIFGSGTTGSAGPR